MLNNRGVAWGGGCALSPGKNKNTKAENNMTADHRLLLNQQNTTTDYRITTARCSKQTKCDVDIFVLNVQKLLTDSQQWRTGTQQHPSYSVRTLIQILLTETKQCICLVMHIRQHNAFFRMPGPFTRPQLFIEQFLWIFLTIKIISCIKTSKEYDTIKLTASHAKNTRIHFG